MNDKGFKIGVLVALIAMIVVVGVGFAAFTTTLNINGTAKVEASSWNIGFSKSSTAITPGEVNVSKGNTQTGIKTTTTVVKQATLTDTTVNDWEVTFKTPGDYAEMNFYVLNKGSFDAKVSTYELPTPTCTGTGDNAAADAKNVCDHLEYTLVRENVAGNKPFAVGDPLYKNTGHAALILRLTYKDDVTDAELPKGEVTISNLGFSIVFTQA